MGGKKIETSDRLQEIIDKSLEKKDKSRAKAVASVGDQSKPKGKRGPVVTPDRPLPPIEEIEDMVRSLVPPYLARMGKQ